MSEHCVVGLECFSAVTIDETRPSRFGAEPVEGIVEGAPIDDRVVESDCRSRIRHDDPLVAFVQQTPHERIDAIRSNDVLLEKAGKPPGRIQHEASLIAPVHGAGEQRFDDVGLLRGLQHARFEHRYLTLEHLGQMLDRCGALLGIEPDEVV